METQRDLATRMAEVATQLQDARGERPTVEAIVAAAGDVVPDTAAASITLRTRRGRHATLASSSLVAEDADQWQYEDGEGPCIDAADDHADYVRSGDVGVDARWPTWGPRAAGRGVGSLLSVPLYAREQRIGALNLYSHDLQQFASRETVDLALLYAVHAAHALTAARAVSSLEVALTSRHTIGVAQGIVMERYGLGLEQAFGLLRRVSSQTNTKLAEVAREVLATGRVPGA